MNVINLSSQNLSPTEIEVLSLGLGFSPDCNINKFDVVKDLNLFVRKLCLKVLHHKKASQGDRSDPLVFLSKSEYRELKELLLKSDTDSAPELSVGDPGHIDLIDLLDLGGYLDKEDPLKPSLEGLKKKSVFFPPTTISPNAKLFLKKVTMDILDCKFSRTPHANLTAPQTLALEKLKSYEHLTIKGSD